MLRNKKSVYAVAGHINPVTQRCCQKHRIFLMHPLQYSPYPQICPPTAEGWCISYSQHVKCPSFSLVLKEVKEVSRHASMFIRLFS